MDGGIRFKHEEQKEEFPKFMPFDEQVSKKSAILGIINEFLKDVKNCAVYVEKKILVPATKDEQANALKKLETLASQNSDLANVVNNPQRYRIEREETELTRAPDYLKQEALASLELMAKKAKDVGYRAELLA